MRRVVLVSSASASPRTTVGRELAHRLGVPFYELGALDQHAGWVEASSDELRTAVEPLADV